MGCGGSKRADGTSSVKTRSDDELKLHPEILLRKEMIFNEPQFKLRKTKIICTLG